MTDEPAANPAAAPTTTRLGAVRAVLGNAGIRRIELAWTCGIAADGALMVGLLVVAFAAGGPLAVGLLGVARTAPAIVTGPMAGLLASRSHPTSLLRVVHVARAAASAALTVWVTMGLPFWGVLLLLVLAALAGSLVRPLQLAAMPSLARDPGELVAANVVMSTGEGVGSFIGPLVAGLAVAVSGPPVAVGLATLVFVVGAFSILGLRPGADTQSELRHRRGAVPTPIAPGLLAALKHSLVAGPAALRQLPGAAAIVIDFNGQVLCRGLVTTLSVVASFELLGLGDAGVGLLGAAFGLGSLIGALGSVGLAGRRRLGPTFAVALSLWSLPVALIGVAPFTPVALAALAASGIANGILDVAGLTLLQRGVPTSARVHVLGTFEASVGVTQAIGSLLAPILILAFGSRGALGITGAILPVLAVATWPWILRVDDEAQIPDDELRLLRGIPLFAPLPMTALERLAGAMRPTAHAAGEVIYREGEPGDTYLIIAEGEVRGQRRRPAGQPLPGRRRRRRDRAAPLRPADGDGHGAHADPRLLAVGRGLPRCDRRPDQRRRRASHRRRAPGAERVAAGADSFGQGRADVSASRPGRAGRSGRRALSSRSARSSESPSSASGNRLA